MQLTIDIGYDQLVQLAQQLPPWEREQLAKKIVPTEQAIVPEQEELADAESCQYQPRQDLIVLEQGDGYRIVQVPFPDTEEGRLAQKEQEELQKKYRENHPECFVPKTQEEIEKNRQERRRSMAALPVATQEDIDYYNEAREQFRWRMK